MEQNQQPQPPVFNPGQPAQQPAPQFQPRVTARPMMGFIEAVKTCMSKYFTFTGRARRSEFWWFMLFITICSMAISFLTGICVGMTDVDTLYGVQLSTIISVLVSLFFVVPQLAAMTRRLHDTGRSGWWVAALALLSCAYVASYVVVMMPLLGVLETTTSPVALAEALTDAMASSPIAATVMSFSALPLIILGIVIFVFTLLDSKWNENKYGPSPKYQ